jgi:hypothetical protein
MNRHVLRGLLALYPRAWRDRYGPEVASLTDELIAGGETTPLQGALDLLAGALAERGRALAESRSVALATTIAAIVAVAASVFATTRAVPAPTSASLISVRCLVRPGFSELAVVPAKVKPGQPSRAIVWVKVARPVRGAEPRPPHRASAPPKNRSGPCVPVPKLCRIGSGKLHGVTVPVPVRQYLCVIAVPELRGLRAEGAP